MQGLNQVISSKLQYSDGFCLDGDQNAGFGGCFGKSGGLRLLSGQRHDIYGVEPLPGDGELGALLADKAFDADGLVKDLTE